MATPSFYNFIADQGYETLKPLWNEYTSYAGDRAQVFDSIEELAETSASSPLELARMVFFGNLQNWGDNVYLNGYGNIESCWSVESSPIIVSELADWLEESDHEFFQKWESEHR